MEIKFVLEGFYYEYSVLINKAEHIGEELNNFLLGKNYITDIQLDEISFYFIDIEHLKCRVRPRILATRDMKNPPYDFSCMTLFFEIPMPETEFIKVSDEDIPTYIGKALMKVLESQNVPTKIRKQFDRERFIADVRDFFVNVKGCKLD